jgi:glucan 1,3-beta-glucosidase
VAAAEHHVLYQYLLKDARDHYLGLIQTESVSFFDHVLCMRAYCLSQPYFQPTPSAPTPFPRVERYVDPETKSGMAWALWVERSHDITIFGALFFH